MLVATEPMETAEPETPSRRDFQDRMIWGTRDSVNTKSTGVTNQPGSSALPTAMTSATGTHLRRTRRRFSTRARTTERFRHAEATVLVMSEGEPIRKPYPSHAAFDVDIITHIVMLTPRPCPSDRTFRVCGHACSTPSMAATYPKNSASDTCRN